MNPAGIPVFYGALDQNTCISEIRSAVGETVIGCSFEILRPLRVFDLAVFNEVRNTLSMFDPNYSRKRDHLEFLRSFEITINKPVLPHDEEIEYIPTQALVEYLENHYEPRIDAIIYSSIQTGGTGKNIAVLNHAADVEILNEKELSDDFKDRYDIMKARLRD